MMVSWTAWTALALDLSIQLVAGWITNALLEGLHETVLYYFLGLIIEIATISIRSLSKLCLFAYQMRSAVQLGDDLSFSFC